MSYQKNDSVRKRVLPAAILMALLLLGALFAFSLNVGAAQAQAGETAETTARLNFREGPGLDAAIIRTFPVGAEVTFTGFTDATGNWAQVQASDGVTGWVFAEFLSNVPEGLQPPEEAVDEEAPADEDEDAFPTTVVTATTTANLNLRNGPGLTSDVMETLPLGTVVGFTGFRDASGNWVQVDPAVAPVGWVAAQFLSNVPEGLNVLAEQVGDLTPSVTVEEQLIGDSNSVTIAQVVATQPGWLVIHRDDDGSPGAVIGHAAVDAGVNDDVVVAIDPAQATNTLHAMLHVDEGQVGVYEFPGADGPVTVGGEVVVRPFDVQPAEADFSGDVVTATTLANLNLREGPGLGFDVIQTLPFGTVVGFTGFTDASGNWVQVDPADGPVGWVHADFLSNVPGGLQVAEDAP